MDEAVHFGKTNCVLLKNIIQKLVKVMEQYLGNTRQKLFVGLICIEIVNIIIEIVAGEFMNDLFRILIRFMFLLAANYCNQMNFAIFYSVFTIFSALDMVDPVGLFVVGHPRKTTLQSVFCIVSLLLSLVAAYLGYLYGKEIGDQVASGSQSDNYQSFSRPINRPAAQPSNQSYNSYGGTNYLYQNPQNPINPPRQESQRNQFQAFSGQGYSLE